MFYRYPKYLFASLTKLRPGDNMTKEIWLTHNPPPQLTLRVPEIPGAITPQQKTTALSAPVRRVELPKAWGPFFQKNTALSMPVGKGNPGIERYLKKKHA